MGVGPTPDVRSLYLGLQRAVDTGDAELPGWSVWLPLPAGRPLETAEVLAGGAKVVALFRAELQFRLHVATPLPTRQDAHAVDVFAIGQSGVDRLPNKLAERGVDMNAMKAVPTKRVEILEGLLPCLDPGRLRPDRRVPKHLRRLIRIAPLEAPAAVALRFAIQRDAASFGSGHQDVNVG